MDFQFEGLKNTKKSIKPPIVNRELRSLTAELGVEKYKILVLQEEIKFHKEELERSNAYPGKLKALQSDYELLQSSVKRSRHIQVQQQAKITELKSALKRLQSNN